MAAGYELLRPLPSFSEQRHLARKKEKKKEKERKKEKYQLKDNDRFYLSLGTL